MKDVMIVTGAGQISLAITRRMGAGKKIVVGDKSPANAAAFCGVLNKAGFDAEPFEMDMSDRTSIKALVARACELGPVMALVNGAGVSPSQAPIEAILAVDLYGTAALLEEVGAVIERGAHQLHQPRHHRDPAGHRRVQRPARRLHHRQRLPD